MKFNIVKKLMGITFNWRRTFLQAWVLALPMTLVACGGDTNIKPNETSSSEKPGHRYTQKTEMTSAEVKVLGAKAPEQVPESSELTQESLSDEEQEAPRIQTEASNSQDLIIDYQPVVYFNYNQDTLSEDMVKIVQHYAKILLDDPMLCIKLLGHTDERGSPEYNLALGERRAKSVNEMMILFGVDPERIEVISYGEEKPAVDEHNEAAWAKNRRVEIVIY